MREGGLGKAENNKHLYSLELSCLELDTGVQGISADPGVVYGIAKIGFVCIC